jgi:hypothetical protein
MTRSWEHNDPHRADADTAALVGELVTLARNDEACRLLGVEGALADYLPLTFLRDPFDWMAWDIAAALREAETEGQAEHEVDLSIIAAQLRLFRLLRGEVDELALTRAIEGYLSEAC